MYVCVNVGVIRVGYISAEDIGQDFRGWLYFIIYYIIVLLSIF